MATVTPPRATNLEQDQVRIHSPLTRLRKYIHAYVGIEGLALVGLFLALYFWIGLVLDYGFFKLFLLDWVQSLPWAFRAVVLGLVVAALLVVLLSTVLVRLLRQFSDSAMALLLERRFPDVLGDRLITAVELADPQEAAAHGYSPALVRETIHEAAERVDQVPVKQVFDWQRLINRGLFLALLTLGMYVLATGSFCVARVLSKKPEVLAGVSDFNDVAEIWVERNVLLRNTIWPRRAYLEVLPWPRKETGGEEEELTELAIPQNTTPPALRVRAWKYVLADREAPEGWRLLRWEDLRQQPDLARHVDLPELPIDWHPRDGKYGMTLDEIELLVEQFPLQKVAGEAKWRVISPSDEAGWRTLSWSELTREKLVGLDVPGIPGHWDPKALPALIAGLTNPAPVGGAARVLLGPRYIQLSVDEIEKKLEEAEKIPAQHDQKVVAAVRAVFDRLGQLSAIRDVIARVGETASDRDMRRVLRKLVVPFEVTLSYSSVRSTSTSAMTRIAGNEYTGNFSELKESVTFTVRGEDYVTPPRGITVVERPRIDVLKSEEERPAYLYYHVPSDGAAGDLVRKRQPLEAINLSVSGEATTVEVPAGTNITLRGQLSKPLRSIGVEVEERDKKTFVGQNPEKVDEAGFVMKLPDVTRQQQFKLIFEDSDGVVGERKVVIIAKEDTSPRIREFAPDDLIRRGRGNEGFIIAAGCRIPFRGRVVDDHGLSRVRFACRVLAADFLSEQKVKALFGLAAVPLLAPSPASTHLLGVGYLAALSKDLSAAASDEAGPEQYVELDGFEQALEQNRPGDGRKEMIERATLLSLLGSKQREPFRKLLREFLISPDRWLDEPPEVNHGLEDPTTGLRRVLSVRWPGQEASKPANDLLLRRLTWRDKEGRDRPIREQDLAKPQKRFQIEVRLLADDTYLEGEVDPVSKKPLPHVSPSGETFTFVVVPDNELLSRIAEEEETKYREMQKAFKPLPENQPRLLEVSAALSGMGVDEKLLTSYVARCDSMAEVLKTSHQDVKSVHATYERIIREMLANDLSESVRTRVYTTISLPLADLAGRQFDRTYDALIALRRAMDAEGQPLGARIADAQTKAEDARKELNKLIGQMQAVLNAMEGLAKINELIAELAQIERQEEDLESLVKKILRLRIDEALKGD